MKTLLAISATLLLCACNALGGIQPETVDAIASAGGGCVRVKSLLLGEGIIMVGSADKGVIRNGKVTVGADCGGISIEEAPKPPVVK